MSEGLACRLLRLSSGSLPLILSGRTLRDHLGPELDRALGRRVLVELPRLDEWRPCAGCDQGCEVRPIRVLDGRLVAMCPHDSTSDEVLSDDDVRQFRLEAEELCLAIREDSGLVGDGPKEIAAGIWLIGQTIQQGAPARVIFVAFETGLGAAVIAMLKRVAGPRPVSLLFARHADLVLHLALEDAEIVPAAIAELLVEDSRAPFRLDTDLLNSTGSRPRLVLRCSDGSVTFNRRSEMLSPQSFELLLFMVMEGEAGRPLIDNRAIGHKRWGMAIHSQRVADPIRRLRDALAPVLGGREQADRLIQNQPGSRSVP